MTRRSFLGRIFGAVAVAAAAPFLPCVVAPPIPRLDLLYGFAPVSEPLGCRVAEDRETGIAIRFVREFDIAADRRPARLDWIYLAPDAE